MRMLSHHQATKKAGMNRPVELLGGCRHYLYQFQIEYQNRVGRDPSSGSGAVTLFRRHIDHPVVSFVHHLKYFIESLNDLPQGQGGRSPLDLLLSNSSPLMKVPV